MPCKCYHADKNSLGKIGVCWGTKECEACSCGGDEAKCDFYDYVRERASLSQKQTLADRIRAMSDKKLACYLNHVETDGRVYGPQGETYWLDLLRQEAKGRAGIK